MKPRLHIFRTGQHRSHQGNDVSFSSQELAAIAARYSPDTFEAPLVVGHPVLNAPAYGWVDKLVADGGNLFAEPTDVDPAFAQMVNDGRFRKISIELFGPNSPANPVPGELYLKHVGFLGAAAPSVKGLKSVQFASGEDDEVVRFEFAAPETEHLLARVASQVARITRHLRERIIADDGLDEANETIPGWEADSASRTAAEAEDNAYDDSYSEPNTDPTMGLLKKKTAARAPTAEPQVPPTAVPDNPPPAEPEADDTASFAEENEALRKRVERLEARERELERAEHASFADKLIDDGRVLPRHRDSVVAIMDACSLSEEKVSFAEEGAAEEPLTDAARDLFEALPATVSFAEHTRTAAKPRNKNAKLPTAAQIKERQKKVSDAGETISFADAQQELIEESQTPAG